MMCFRIDESRDAHGPGTHVDKLFKPAVYATLNLGILENSIKAT